MARTSNEKIGKPKRIDQHTDRIFSPFFLFLWGINPLARVPDSRGCDAMGMPGSQRHVERLVEEHYASLYRYAYRLTGSEADAEDLTQEAFCKAQMNLGQLREPDRARSWLYSILRNAYLHRVRTEKTQPSLSLDLIGELPESPVESLPDVDPDQLQKALGELPEVFRTPILLYYFDDFSYREIADQMDLPIGTVMSRLARAKAWLRMKLLPATHAGFDPGEGRVRDGL
jgi:RNA polymerase sigma-70 factor (ECF subfamily)